MSRVARIMMVAGLALVIAGLIFALGASYQLEHEARLAAYDAYQTTFETLMKNPRSLEWQGELALANQTSLNHRRVAAVHTHGVNMGILLILAGLFVPMLYGPGRSWLLRALTAAAWLYPAGLLLKFTGPVALGEILAALGAMLAIISFAGFAWLLTRSLDDTAHPSA